MSLLLNGDCLEQMKEIDDSSIDFIFCDLPYGQTSCKWDVIIAWEPFWKEIMRVKKINTPIFMTTTTKFGVQIINSAPKKCPFRYDLVWVKSAPAGFLLAKKMPMRKHEMVYCFYEKLPFYDLSSHKHKFLKKEEKQIITGEELMIKDGQIYNGGKAMPCSDMRKGKGGGHYDPALPVSIVKEEKQIIKGENNTYNTEGRKKPIVREKAGKYDPALPVSVVKELTYKPSFEQKDNADNQYRKMGRKGGESAYDPPLPVSVVKEDGTINSETYGTDNRKNPLKQKGSQGVNYDPPLPVSVVKEDVYNSKERFKNGKLKKHARNLQKGDDPIYDPALPVSVVKEGCGMNKGGLYSGSSIEDNGIKTTTYDPPLPNTMLEIKSTRGKHSTEKPVALMEWLLKYFSKEGDTVLDPTMGSGSTGVACKNMNRNFIGIEKDAEIFEVAVNRIENNF